MKLTKGKLSKLYNKKKQSCKKKINKRKSSNRSKTFRKNKKTNLARKSLKRINYIGGEDPPKSDTPEQNLGVPAEPIASETTTTVDEPVVTVLFNLFPTD